MLLAAGLLALAVVVEVAATAALPSTQGFTHVGWTTFVLGGYALSIWLLAEIVETLPVSVTYAVWSGAGTALVAVIGVLLLGEELDTLKTLGLAAIILGVVMLNIQT